MGSILLIQTILGPLALEGTERALKAVRFGTLPADGGCPLLELAARELQEYLEGRRMEFDIPLAPDGTDFQRQVWAELRKIPYGETVSYGEIAARTGRPKAARAVGMANHRNPIPILIPCHRVVGAGGALVGYGGGLSIKKKLLELEKRIKPNPSLVLEGV